MSANGEARGSHRRRVSAGMTSASRASQLASLSRRVVGSGGERAGAKKSWRRVRVGAARGDGDEEEYVDCFTPPLVSQMEETQSLQIAGRSGGRGGHLPRAAVAPRGGPRRDVVARRRGRTGRREGGTDGRRASGGARRERRGRVQLVAGGFVKRFFTRYARVATSLASLLLCASSSASFAKSRRRFTCCPCPS